MAKDAVSIVRRGSSAPSTSESTWQGADTSAQGRIARGRGAEQDPSGWTQKRLEEVSAFLPDATFVIDTEGKVVLWNRAVEHMTGVKAADMIGKGNYEYAVAFYGERRPILIDLVMLPDKVIERHYDKLLRRGKNFISVETMLPHIDRYVFGTASLIYDSNGTVVGAIESVRDITDRQQAEKAVLESRTRLEEVIAFLPDATFVIDTEGKVVLWNRAVEHMTGVKAADMIGKGNYEYAVAFYGERRPILIDLVMLPDKVIERHYDKLLRRGKNFISVETMLPHIDRYVFGTASLIYDSNGTVVGAIESVRDITERQRAEEEVRESRQHLEEMVAARTAELDLANKDLADRNKQMHELNAQMYLAAMTDPLTGLDNRRRMAEALDSEALRSNRSRRPFSLILADIDHFKDVNDHYGHECGDLVLQHVSSVLRRMVREVDQTARWGGEEFLLLLPETGVEEALGVAERLRRAVAESHVLWQHKEVKVTITVGVAVHGGSGNAERTIRQADEALYRGKEEGRNRVVAWTSRSTG
ncbi:MAG: sensor domain-containing diguanylate cyclase [Acidimicrobiales bacterium]